MSVLSAPFFRFTAIGVVNTLVDVTIFFFAYSYLDLPLILANIISTTAALLTSYALNSRYTFSSKSSKRNLFMFIVITLAGIWVLQPIVILTLAPAIRVMLPMTLALDYAVLLAKILSIGVTMTWNYLWYKNFVFLKPVIK